jgi:glutamate carboxypeptidase
MMQNETLQKIRDFIQTHANEMTNLLAELVNMESPSDDKPSLDALGEYLAGHLRRLTASVTVQVNEQAGNNLKAVWGEGPGGTLMLCHMDTVWDIGTTRERPASIKDGRLYGPGSMDMKGGIVISLFAVRALVELGLLPAERITLVLNSDEEIGSESSRALIEAEAVKHRRVFVMEPAGLNGSYKTQRKGTGNFIVRVRGKATHAGADHAGGANAIEELARQVPVLQGFTNYETGATVNVGVIHGGTRSNVVPDEAWAEVDVRVAVLEEGPKIEALIHGLKAYNPRCTLEITGGMNRPPMERMPGVVALYEQARSLAAQMGIDLQETGTGGASDGNFTAALGVPTLDGMGVVGSGAHGLDEYTEIASLPERAALLAAILIS